MKFVKLALLSLATGVFSAPAAQIRFALSPPGTDAAVGLSPRNEVPPVTNSSASGNTIAEGIVFDTDTSMLHMNIGYGSAEGFRDLTGLPTDMHLHCCAGPGTNSRALVDIMQCNHPSDKPVTGGTINGDVYILPNSVSPLLAGLTYLNVDTDLNPAGEVRAQLIPMLAANNPPSITCVSNSTVECGRPAIVAATVADPDGDNLAVVWALNGTAVQTNAVPGSTSAAGTNVTFSAVLPLGTNLLTATAFDSTGNSASCTTAITVVDTTPPIIHSVTADPDVLWPPNHKMVPIHLRAIVTDTCSPATWKILSVRCNEAANAKGSGHTAPDWQITGEHMLALRAERSGKSGARIYTITIQATDLSGNTSIATVTVSVAHDHASGKK